MDSIVMCGYSVHRQYTSQGEKGRFYTFRLQSHGECDARLNGEPLRLKKGDLLMLVPGDRLAIHKPFNAQDVSDTSGDYYLLCQGEWVAAWFRGLNGRKHLEIPTGESILDLWKLIIRETRRPQDGAGKLRPAAPISRRCCTPSAFRCSIFCTARTAGSRNSSSPA